MATLARTTGAALLLGGSALPVWHVLDEPPRPEPVAASPRAAEPCPAAVVVATVPPVPASPRARSETDPDATLLLPDGTRVPALNGARTPTPLAGAWPANVPWSPILGIERSPTGVDWYVHADGSRSTTEMRWRADLGREDAITRLARPVAAPPPRAPVAPTGTRS